MARADLYQQMIPSVRFWKKRKEGVEILLIQLSWWITKLFLKILGGRGLINLDNEFFLEPLHPGFIYELYSLPLLTSHALVLFNHLCTYYTPSQYSPHFILYLIPSDGTQQTTIGTVISAKRHSSFIDRCYPSRQSTSHHYNTDGIHYIYTRPEPFLLCNTMTQLIGTFQPIYIYHIYYFTHFAVFISHIYCWKHNKSKQVRSSFLTVKIYPILSIYKSALCLQ